MESESDLNIQMKNELKTKDLEIRSLSQLLLDLQQEKKDSISLADDTPSDVTVSGCESSVSSRNMRALRRTLKSEMNVNERMRVELKTKDDEIDQLSRQLHDLKDLRASESSIEEDVVGHHWSKDSDVTKSIEQGVMNVLGDIRSALSETDTVNAYSFVTSNKNDSKISTERTWVMHRILTLRNQLKDTQEKVESTEKKLSLNMSSAVSTTNERLNSLRSSSRQESSSSKKEPQTDTALRQQYQETLAKLKKTEKEKSDLEQKLKMLLDENISQRFDRQLISHEKEELEGHLEKYIKELTHVRDVNDSVKLDNASLEKTVSVTQSNMDALRAKVKELEQSNEKYKHAGETIEKLQQEIKKESKEDEVLNNDIDAITPSVTRLEAEVTSKKTHNVELRDQLHSLRTQLGDLRVELSETQDENITLNKDVEKAKKEMEEGKKNQNKKDKEMAHSVTIENNELKKEITALKDGSEALTKELAKAQREKSNAQSEISTLRSKLIDSVQVTDEPMVSHNLSKAKSALKKSLDEIITSLREKGQLPQQQQQQQQQQAPTATTTTPSGTTTTTITTPTSNTLSVDGGAAAAPKTPSKSRISIFNRSRTDVTDGTSLAIQTAELVQKITEKVLTEHDTPTHDMQGGTDVEFLDRLHRDVVELRRLQHEHGMLSQGNRKKRKRECVEDLMNTLESKMDSIGMTYSKMSLLPQEK